MDDSKRILVDLTNLNRNFDYCDQGHTLTSLDHLLMVQRAAADENEFLTFELEHSIQLLADHQAALKFTNDNINRLKNLKEKLEQKIEKFQHLEVTHSELTNGVTELKEQICSLRNKMEGDTEELKKQNSERMLNDELEFTKKLNELEDKFNEERDRLLGEIDRRKEQFNVMQAKAEFQHFQRKEDLRKKHANEMKAINVHINCRSAELDLKKEIHRLEQLLAGRSASGTAPKKSDREKSRKKSSATIATSATTATTSLKNNNHPALTNDNKRKRKLFNVDHNFLDF